MGCDGTVQEAGGAWLCVDAAWRDPRENLEAKDDPSEVRKGFRRELGTVSERS